MSVIRNDLTSLPNWSQWFNDATKATVGQHTLKVKAKGSGYRDSKLSTAVTFNIYSVSTTLAGCTAAHENRILQYTDVVVVFTAKEGFTFTNTTISTAQIKVGSTAYTPTSADTYVVSTDGTTATLTINAEAVIGNIAVTVALTEKLATPTEFTVTKGLASWNSVDKATAYEFVAVDSNNVESSIGSYTSTTTKTLSGTWLFNNQLNVRDADYTQGVAYTTDINFKINNVPYTQMYLQYNHNQWDEDENQILEDRHSLYAVANTHNELYYDVEYTETIYSGKYTDGFGWSNATYKVINFGSTPQTVTDEFYSWFTANAVKQ